MRKSGVFGWEPHGGQKIGPVKNPRSTGVAFKKYVYAINPSVSMIETKSTVDKLMVEHSRLGQIGVPS